MSRKWSPRKTTAFVAAAVDPAGFSIPDPITRDGPEPAVARREVLRLLTGFTLLGLPVHCGICWVAGHSLGLATAAVLVTVAATLAVAAARWLGLDDLLQRLPLLLVLVGIGLVFVSSLPAKGWQSGGFEVLGMVLILITVVSILGSLYRPLAAAYQTVTQKVPFRDLCVAAAAMLVSLGFAAVNQTCPRFVPPLLACVLAAGFAGLVVIEYAAWARANPTTSLERVRAFDGPPAPAGGKARKPAGPIDGGTALLGAALFGLSYGLLSTLPLYGAEWMRLLRPPEGWTAEEATESFATLFAVGLIGMPLGWAWTASALSALRFPNLFLAPRVAWDALAVFLTYPEASHPLAHRLHTRWLRPLSVRLGGAFVVLVAVATSAVTPPEKPRAAARENKAATRPTSPPQRQRFAPSDDEFSGHGPGLGGQGHRTGPFNSPLPTAAPSDVPSAEAAARPLGDGIVRLFRAALAAAVAGPAFLYLMVVVLGAAALPTYFRYFEKPDSPAPPR